MQEEDRQRVRDLRGEIDKREACKKRLKEGFKGALKPDSPKRREVFDRLDREIRTLEAEIERLENS